MQETWLRDNEVICVEQQDTSSYQGVKQVLCLQFPWQDNEQMKNKSCDDKPSI